MIIINLMQTIYTIVMTRSSKWQLHGYIYQVIFPVNGVKKSALHQCNLKIKGIQDTAYTMIMCYFYDIYADTVSYIYIFIIRVL